MNKAKLSELKAGSVIRADGGFTCVGQYMLHMVFSDPHGKLYFPCGEGEHYLEGQLDKDGDTLVGVYHVV